MLCSKILFKGETSMAETTERKQVISAMAGTKITRVNIMDGGKSIEIYSVPEISKEPTSNTKTQNKGESELDVFVKVEASKLSLDDEFMNYQPRTKKEQKLKEMIETLIQEGLKDFWRPKYDPSFNEEGTGICYKPGNKPAVGKPYEWNAKAAKEFKPECRSRLGTKSEYIAFLAVLIKKLVASGWKISDAWDAVCNDSKKLGHYKTSENAKQGFEDTGSREICGFFDLANTYKILAEDEEDDCFWVGGGHCNFMGNFRPLAYLYHHFNRNDDCYGCGWLVLEDCSTDH